MDKLTSKLVKRILDKGTSHKCEKGRVVLTRFFTLLLVVNEFSISITIQGLGLNKHYISNKTDRILKSLGFTDVE